MNADCGAGLMLGAGRSACFAREAGSPSHPTPSTSLVSFWCWSEGMAATRPAGAERARRRPAGSDEDEVRRLEMLVHFKVGR